MDLQSALAASIAYLSSGEALASLERDPYWPKWDSPWWHMLLLLELGLADRIPPAAPRKLAEVMRRHYLRSFPLREEEIPPGADPRRHILCHCAAGSAYRLLYACGLDPDAELPWLRPWFLKYQLPDGGLNCDEAAYTKAAPKSSVVSTLPCLEAVLFCRKAPLTPEEKAFLDKGAAYLVRHRLFRRLSDGAPMHPDYAEALFPRFYEYDFLRGYYFLSRWSRESGFPVPPELHAEAAALMAPQLGPGGVTLKRYNLPDRRSYNPNPDGTWAMGEASEFALLKAVSSPGAPCPPLTRQWEEASAGGRASGER